MESGDGRRSKLEPEPNRSKLKVWEARNTEQQKAHPQRAWTTGSVPSSEMEDINSVFNIPNLISLTHIQLSILYNKSLPT